MNNANAIPEGNSHNNSNFPARGNFPNTSNSQLYHQAEAVLRQTFGHEAFRPNQQDAIETILGKRDILAVMPTGAGKSLCYQIPAVVLPGTTLVISPLIALMHDQVLSLCENGVKAACINSQTSYGDQTRILRQAKAHQLDLLYVAPERLAKAEFVANVCELDISFVVVDEAHCVSQWGMDFRPAYLAISTFVEQLRAESTAAFRIPLAAFTATATPRVQEEIVSLLGLSKPNIIVSSFNRPNLYFSVEQLDSTQKTKRAVKYAQARPGQTGVIYCSTRKATEKVRDKLLDAGVKATAYHAGMTKEERQHSYQAWIRDDIDVIVATNAFGMGIDKPDVRYVIHYNMPSSLEAHYQEAGRAGRDGQPGDCLLFWDSKDVSTSQHFIEEIEFNEDMDEESKRICMTAHRNMLAHMVSYCTTTGCLRAYMLNYFGESFGDERGAARGTRGGGGGGDGWNDDSGCDGWNNHSGGSGNPTSKLASNPSGAPISNSHSTENCCSNCDGNFELIDVTQDARAIMRCVMRLRGRYGKGIIVDVLRGATSPKVKAAQLDTLDCFGSLPKAAVHIRRVLDLLIAHEYLQANYGEYPVVGYGKRYREAAEPDFTLAMKQDKKAPKASAKDKANAKKGSEGAADTGPTATNYDEALFERLRALRKKLADEKDIPSYIIFQDKSLRDMCENLPTTDEAFLDIYGVGATKLEAYGSTFMDEIRDYLANKQNHAG